MNILRVARFARCFLILLPALSPAVGGESPPPISCFSGEPQDSLIRQLEPGPGFSLALAGAPARDLKRRWVASAVSETERVYADAKSGLTVRRRYVWRPRIGMLFIDTALSCGGGMALDVSELDIADWTFRRHGDALYRELTHRSDVWYGSTYWTGPDWTRVGKDWHHPGIHTPSVRCFAAPRDGSVIITGRVYKADVKCGDGVRVEVRHGARAVWRARLDGGDAAGLEHRIALDVRRGEKIRFVVHKKGSIYCDTTHWDPVVEYAGGGRFQASAGFSTRRQGENGWSYAMEAAGGALPRLRGFRRDLAPVEKALEADRVASLSFRETLPLFAVADEADRSGVVLALDPRGSWALHGTVSAAGSLRLRLELEEGGPLVKLEPGATLRLPRMALGSYRGSWLAGMGRLERLLGAERSVEGFETLRARIASAARRAGPLDADLAPPGRDPVDERAPLDLRAAVEADWRLQDGVEEGAASSYAAAAASRLESIRRLIERLRRDNGDALVSRESEQLERLSARLGGAASLSAARSLYRRVRWLGRRVALANPLMRFGELLFVKRVPTSYSHQVMQYYGWRARPGGGLFVLENPGYSLACRDVIAGRLAAGNVLEPRLSYDGRRIVFSFVECAGESPAPREVDNRAGGRFYHIYEVNVDGTGLQQLTRGPFDDLMPAYLPDGGIVFCSTRRRGYSRCFGEQFSRRWDVYTLHRMDADGDNIRALSFHDTNEWFPAVSHTGVILYSRWDYIDRDAVTHQNLWATRPDGGNPVAVWGNATSSPHCTFQPQPIPGSGKIVFTASAHHSITAGSIAIVDPSVSVDGHSAIERVTPEIPFPEAESRNIQEYYAAPWPLSETYFLVAYSPKALVWEPGANERNALGIYLLDVFGNRELLYRDPDIGSTNPCPLRPRPQPPALASDLPSDPPPTGEMLLIDVYQGLGAVPRGTVKEIRVVQIFPKTTPVANRPPVGLAGEENARAILGTVPVEEDGSARFLVPARKPILFQALDQDGLAFQTMRSVTYVQPGERVACIGCHENRPTAPLNRGGMAFRRAPSRIDPGALGGRPFSFVRVVQPVLDARCVRCHGGEKLEGDIDLRGDPHKGFTRSYWALCGDRDFTGQRTNPENAAAALVPRFGARNPIQATPPGGRYGALGSRLIRMLREGHHDVTLGKDELRRLAAWIDLNAIFYGSYRADDQARQLRGEVLAMPAIE